MRVQCIVSTHELVPPLRYVYLLLSAPLWYAIILYIENKQLSRDEFDNYVEKDAPAVVEDSDVLAEAARVESGERDDDLIVTKRLRKVFQSKPKVGSRWSLLFRSLCAQWLAVSFV